jgi:hypothetical protein
VLPLISLLALFASTDLPSADYSIASDDGALRASLPCRPQPVSVPRSQPEGGSLTSHRFKCSEADFSAVVEYIDSAPSPVAPKMLLDRLRDGAISSVKGGQLVSERAIEIAGRPGRDLDVSAPGNKALLSRLLVDSDSRRTRLVIANYTTDRAARAHPRIRVFFDSLTFTTGPGASLAAAPAPAARPVLPPAPPPAAGGWATYSPADGMFSLLLPGRPKVETRNLDTKAGNARTTTYMVEVGRSAWWAATVDYPAATVSTILPQDALSGARDGMLANMNGKLTSDRQIFLPAAQKSDGVIPGREFTGVARLGNDEFILRVHIYRVNDRLYQLASLCPRAEDSKAGFDRMANSFRLTR